MFKTPSNILVVGPTSCGRTFFTRSLIEHKDELFDPPPKTVHYCYGAWQPAFEKMRKVTFHEGLPTKEDLDAWYMDRGGLLVLGDLMDEAGRDKNVLDLFTKHSHQKGISVVSLLQDLFPGGPHSKTISRNAHYFIIFKNPRDCSALQALLLQAYGKNFRNVMELFREQTSKPYGYLMFDFHPASDDQLRLWTHVLPHEGPTQAFVPKKEAISVLAHPDLKLC